MEFECGNLDRPCIMSWFVLMPLDVGNIIVFYICLSCLE